MPKAVIRLRRSFTSEHARPLSQASHTYVAAVGNAMETASPGQSLVITRNLNTEIGKQTFIPSRFLQVCPFLGLFYVAALRTWRVDGGADLCSGRGLCQPVCWTST